MDFSYPLSLKAGKLQTVSDPSERLRQAIVSAVQTYAGERVMRPAYGISTRPFDSLSLPRLLADIRQAILAGIDQPLTFKLSAVPTDTGQVDITVSYLDTSAVIRL